MNKNIMNVRKSGLFSSNYFWLLIINMKIIWLSGSQN